MAIVKPSGGLVADVVMQEKKIRSCTDRLRTQSARNIDMGKLITVKN